MQTNDYIITDIDGEYATLKDSEGNELFIALSLLPFGADLDTKIHFENFEYTIIG